MPATVPDCSPCYWPWDYSYWAERYVVVSHTVHLNYNYSHCTCMSSILRQFSDTTKVMLILKAYSSYMYVCAPGPRYAHIYLQKCYEVQYTCTTVTLESSCNEKHEHNNYVR